MPSAGADLKEREQMSAVEVGIFVQRLRGLMSEIGESLRAGWRAGGPCWHLLCLAHPGSKGSILSVWSSVKAQGITWGGAGWVGEGHFFSSFLR